jgi:hypothetical protein
MITINGTVGSTGKYLVTGIPVDTKTHAVLKIAFENQTSGTNLGLFAGTDADFTAGSGGLQLSDFRRPRVHIPDHYRYPQAIGQNHLCSARGRNCRLAIQPYGGLMGVEKAHVGFSQERDTSVVFCSVRHFF